jgi:hypothetical protein
MYVVTCLFIRSVRYPMLQFSIHQFSVHSNDYEEYCSTVIVILSIRSPTRLLSRETFCFFTRKQVIFPKGKELNIKILLISETYICLWSTVYVVVKRISVLSKCCIFSESLSDSGISCVV